MNQSLFCTTVSDDSLDDGYRHLRDSDACHDDRKRLQDDWSIYSPFVDRNFHDQFQRAGQFQSRCWELRLGSTLLGKGLRVRQQRRSAGPDICVEMSDRCVWIEAVAPATTDSLKANHQRAARGTPVPEDEVILRYTQVLTDKLAKYQGYITKGIVDSRDPLLIAVSGANLHYPDDDFGPPWIAKPLFAIGRGSVTVEVGIGIVGSGWQHMPLRTNANGALVNSAMFFTDAWKIISGVIFSLHHVKNRPEAWGREAGRDFQIFHNPQAKCPLPEGFLAFGREWVVVHGKLTMVRDHRAPLANR